MNYRNAKHIADGRIDCEIEHPTYGWIPFTCNPTDTGAAFDVVALYDLMAADPETTAYVPPTQEELDAAATAALEAARASMTLTFAELMIGLVTEAWITEVEGEAWLAGTLPFAVLTVIDGLPEGQRFAAKARALRPSEVLRADPLVIAMGTAAGKTAEQIDQFFQTYAQV